jgi:hypothetical protein
VRRLFVSFFFFAVVGSVCASLGDHGDRIEDSYGNVVARDLHEDGTVAILYHKDRYLYLVTFDNDVSVSERYSLMKQADLSEKEIARFLKANAGRTMTWIQDRKADPKKERRFERSDHKAEATVAKADDRLALTVRKIGGR